MTVPYPFLTSDERPRPEKSNRPQAGVRVTYASNVCHFFPGQEAVALLLARQFVPPELFVHPGTTVEFGEKSGTVFVLRRHISGPPLSRTTKEERDAIPSMIYPE